MKILNLWEGKELWKMPSPFLRSKNVVHQYPGEPRMMKAVGSCPEAKGHVLQNWRTIRPKHPAGKESRELFCFYDAISFSRFVFIFHIQLAKPSLKNNDIQSPTPAGKSRATHFLPVASCQRFTLHFRPFLLQRVLSLCISGTHLISHKKRSPRLQADVLRVCQILSFPAFFKHNVISGPISAVHCFEFPGNAPTI